MRWKGNRKSPLDRLIERMSNPTTHFQFPVWVKVHDRVSPLVLVLLGKASANTMRLKRGNVSVSVVSVNSLSRSSSTVQHWPNWTQAQWVEKRMNLASSAGSGPNVSGAFSKWLLWTSGYQGVSHSVWLILWLTIVFPSRKSSAELYDQIWIVSKRVGHQNHKKREPKEADVCERHQDISEIISVP
jgi:hypothetical protein